MSKFWTIGLLWHWTISRLLQKKMNCKKHRPEFNYYKNKQYNDENNKTTKSNIFFHLTANSMLIVSAPSPKSRPLLPRWWVQCQVLIASYSNNNNYCHSVLNLQYNFLANRLILLFSIIFNLIYDWKWLTDVKFISNQSATWFKYISNQLVTWITFISTQSVTSNFQVSVCVGLQNRDKLFFSLVIQFHTAAFISLHSTVWYALLCIHSTVLVYLLVCTPSISLSDILPVTSHNCEAYCLAVSVMQLMLHLFVTDELIWQSMHTIYDIRGGGVLNHWCAIDCAPPGHSINIIHNKNSETVLVLYFNCPIQSSISCRLYSRWLSTYSDVTWQTNYKSLSYDVITYQLCVGLSLLF